MWAVFSSLIFVVLLTIILLLHPEAKFVKNGLLDINSVKNAVILTILTSISIYMITLFVKLATSSYHLARDARERYQLTHIYLSLLKEDAIRDEERTIIIQSLFSRADTGLLKGDSSPTVPDSLGQIIKLLSTKSK